MIAADKTIALDFQKYLRKGPFPLRSAKRDFLHVLGTESARTCVCRRIEWARFGQSREKKRDMTYIFRHERKDPYWVTRLTDREKRNGTRR